MKKLRILSSIILLLLFALGISLQAQTKQVFLHAELNAPVFCLEKVLTGEWTYHISYHVNKKTGAVTNLHWNVIHSNLLDSEGNRYKLQDVGNDNLGAYWALFNGLNAYNDAFLITLNEELGTDYSIHYTPEDGYMEGSTDNFPDMGRIAPATIKFIGIGTGEKFYFTSYIRGYIDENGDLVAVIDRTRWDCNGF